MARLLIEKETIYQEEIDLIMEGKDANTIIEFMDKRQAEKDANPFKKVDTKITEVSAPVEEKTVENNATEKVEEKVEEPAKQDGENTENN